MHQHCVISILEVRNDRLKMVCMVLSWWGAEGNSILSRSFLTSSMLMTWHWWPTPGVTLQLCWTPWQSIGLSISCNKTKLMAVLPSESHPRPEPYSLVSGSLQLRWCLASSTWEALYRMTAALLLRWTPESARHPKPFVRSAAFCGTSARSRLALSSVSSPLSSYQPCFTAWRALCLCSLRSTACKAL